MRYLSILTCTRRHCRELRHCPWVCQGLRAISVPLDDQMPAVSTALRGHIVLPGDGQTKAPYSRCILPTRTLDTNFTEPEDKRQR